MKAVFGFGRLNPPTIGHKMIVDRVVELAHECGGDPFLFVTRTVDDRNPLPPEEKLAFIRELFPTVRAESVTTFFDAAARLSDLGYTNARLVVGEDRAHEFAARFLPYLGTQHLRLERLEIVALPRPEGAISATQARAAAGAGDWLAFMNAAGNGRTARNLFDAVRKRMKMCSEFEDCIRGSDAAQRRQKPDRDHISE